MRTAIAKRPVRGRVPVGAVGLAGDRALVAAVLALPELAEEWRGKTAPRAARAA